LKKWFANRAEALGGWLNVVTIGVFALVAVGFVANAYLWSGILFSPTQITTVNNPEPAITSQIGSAQPSKSPTPHKTTGGTRTRHTSSPTPSASETSVTPSTLPTSVSSSPTSAPVVTITKPPITEPTSPETEEPGPGGGGGDPTLPIDTPLDPQLPLNETDPLTPVSS